MNSFAKPTEVTVSDTKNYELSRKGDIKNVSVKDLDKPIAKDIKEVKGGSYAEVKKTSNGETHEVHHMPADSASNLERADGPAIKMEKADHRRTASCGHSREAQEYQAAQKKLIDNGEFRKALKMDIDDIREKFGAKYNKAISEMNKYVDKLEAEGKI